MKTVTVIGGTGYVGSHLVAAAADRGFKVTSLSRRAPEESVEGVDYLIGDVTDAEVMQEALAGADAVISALSPRGNMAGEVLPTLHALADEARESGVRLGVIGGAGSLLIAPGGPALYDTPEFHPDWLSEAKEMGAVLADLRAAEEDLDWFFVSPPRTFGSYVPGEHLGRYRVGGDVVLTDDHGNSTISGSDFAEAVLDEIERPAHRRKRFTVAY